MNFKDKHENLMNEMMCLSEVRGELDSVSNAKVEAKLAEIGDELRAIDEARDELFDHFVDGDR
tara:strand:- start:692 stop:880 length:189 start_codon:yes stop_codon:yes gene_type:complete